MLDVTHTFMEIQDGDVVIVKPDSVVVIDADNNAVEREQFEVDVDPSDSEKGVYPYYMLKEIDEQPNVMRKLSKKYLDENGTPVIDEKLLDVMKNSDRIYIVGAGTSYHAGLVGKKQLETLTGIPTEVHVASEFAYRSQSF